MRALCFLSLFLGSVCVAFGAPEDAQTVVAGTNQFGLDLHRLTASPDANACISPYSLQCAFAMLYAGADGETRAEIGKVFHFPDDDAVLQLSFTALAHGFNDSIKASTKAPDFVPAADLSIRPIVFTVANGLFAQQGFPFEPAYLNLLRDFYHAPLVPTDFKGNPDRAVGQISGWSARSRAAPDGRRPDQIR